MALCASPLFQHRQGYLSSVILATQAHSYKAGQSGSPDSRVSALVEQLIKARVARLAGISPALLYGSNRRIIRHATRADEPSCKDMTSTPNTGGTMHNDPFSTSICLGQEGQNHLSKCLNISELKVVDWCPAHIVRAKALVVCLQQAIVPSKLALRKQAYNAANLPRLHKRDPGVYHSSGNNRERKARAARAKDRRFVRASSTESVSGITHPLG